MLKPKITITGKKQFQEIYDGYNDSVGAHNIMDVGIGTETKQVYATKAYQKKKRSQLIFGALNSIIYSGMEHDKNPLILPFYYEPQYNTVMAYNMHYVPPKMRAQLLDFILRQNINNIKTRNPLVIDYHTVKQKFPWSQHIVRRYKRIGMTILDAHPIMEWQGLIQQPNRWQTWWKDSQKEKPKNSKSIVHRIKQGAKKIFRR